MPPGEAVGGPGGAEAPKRDPEPCASCACVPLAARPRAFLGVCACFISRAPCLCVCCFLRRVPPAARWMFWFGAGACQPASPLPQAMTSGSVPFFGLGRVCACACVLPHSHGALAVCVSVLIGRRVPSAALSGFIRRCVPWLHAGATAIPPPACHRLRVGPVRAWPRSRGGEGSKEVSEV